MSEPDVTYSLCPICMDDGELRLIVARHDHYKARPSTDRHESKIMLVPTTTQIHGARQEGIVRRGVAVKVAPNGSSEFYADILLMSDGFLRVQVHHKDGLVVTDPQGIINEEMILQRSPTWWVPVVR